MTDEGEKAIQESAKAVQEVAKTTKKALELTEKAGPFLERTFGPLVENAAGLLSDRLAYFRLAQFFKLVDKTKKLLDDRHVEDTRYVPTSFAIPLIEAATAEEDETLHDIWAHLLANAIDPNRPQAKRAFVGIVRQFDPLDARLLKFLTEHGWDLFKVQRHPQAQTLQEGVGPQGFTVARLSESLGVEQRDIATSLLNLFRLGCVVDETPETMGSLDTTTSGLRVHNERAIFRPTQLGWDLIEASSQ